MYSLAYLLLQNKDSILGLPEWAKTLCIVGLIWMFASSVLHKITGLLWVAIVLAVAYFGCTYFGIL